VAAKSPPGKLARFWSSSFPGTCSVQPPKSTMVPLLCNVCWPGRGWYFSSFSPLISIQIIGFVLLGEASVKQRLLPFRSLYFIC
jgi:hypothetical protein